MVLICRTADAQMCLSQAAADWLITGLTLLSVAAAAGFGLLGLFTEYKDDRNQVTVWGRLAAAGIVGSALLSVLLATLQDNLKAIREETAAKAAKAERDADAAIFKRQLSGLLAVQQGVGTVLGQSEKVRTRLESSIATQQRQLDAANGVARDLASGNRAAQANAETLLRSLWETAEQVSPRDVTVRVALYCRFADVNPMNPDRRGDGSVPAVPKVVPTAFSSRVKLRMTAFSSGTLPAASDREVSSDPDDHCTNGLARQCATPPLWTAVTDFYGLRQPPSITSIPRRGGGFLEFRQAMGFSELVADNTRLNRRSAWNGLELDVRLTANDSAFRALFDDADLVEPKPVGPPHTVDATFVGDHSGPPPRILVELGSELLPCQADVDVLLANRLIARGSGVLSNVFGEIAIVMPPLQVAADTFPVYAPATSPTPEYRRGSPIRR